MSSAVSTPDSVLQQLQWRYATKKFDPSKKIPDEVWKALEQSMVLAPSSFGLQPWKFFVVSNPELRQQLLPHSWGQAQVVDASHLVVFAIKKDLNAADVDRYLDRMAEVQQTPVENLQKFGSVVKGFMDKPPYPLDINEWSTRQVYIALGQFMTAAAFLGIDTCPMEGFIPSQYDEVLELPAQGYKAVVVCPAGYRSQEDHSAQRPKVRFKTEDVVEYIN
ncbi:NAD(P)H-dependent oxidoreductase [Calothrix sp. UHCC 0171]|uniref:NAD(P)H-dependent oxidoreductase n=1 Tax=Calothrix sp. UHCC 0171 TaxID=3110245 RepID=UPI002B1EF087|nr:NAD(P)H-dependent oxidoreductase [Calothrix sp. UHCC 0171]MEA5572134.1 NAD(P)H-dependent oxidoreductase [Calothrix sp. UHCC 0171]